MQKFVHLKVHTEYSLLDSVVRVPELMAATATAGMGAVALTDECNLFAMVKFYKAALAAGVKPIIGVDLWLAEGERQPASRLTLLCQNHKGYLNLSRLVSSAYLEGERQARRLLKGWQDLLGDRFYIELQRLGRGTDGEYVAAAVHLAAESGAPVVATNDVRFLEAGDYEAHEARVCIRERTLLADANRRRRYTREQYLRTPDEMAALFADIPEALANSVEIARRCSLPLKLGQSQLPVFPTPDGSSAEDYLRIAATEGLLARMQAARADATPAAIASDGADATPAATASDGAVPEEYAARLE